MSIWGIIIGGAAGFALGGPIGALLGAAAGHVAERGIKQVVAPDQAKHVAFTVAVVALSAKMARTQMVLSHAQKSKPFAPVLISLKKTSNKWQNSGI